MSEKQSDHFYPPNRANLRYQQVDNSSLIAINKALCGAVAFPCEKGLHLFWLLPALVFVIANHLKLQRQVISDGLRFSRLLANKHRIAITKEAILLFYRMFISGHGVLIASKRTHQHDQGRFR